MSEGVPALAPAPREGFVLACPRCARPFPPGRDVARCPVCAMPFARDGGIWRLLPPERELALRRFIVEYRHVRRGEGWGGAGDAYFRALPYRDLTGRFVQTWRIRAASFRALVERVLAPLERAVQRPLAVLDVGAGNCWLSYRLAQRGHDVAAVDLSDDGRDGLGAHVHYPCAFLPVLADFDHLPFAAARADLVLYNAALHYSTDINATLSQALRVLRPSGTVVVMDSPVYHDPVSGATMIAERERAFAAAHGTPSDALAAEGFLTYRRLHRLADELGLRWRFIHPAPFWPMAAAGLVARLGGRRETATFPLVVGRRREAP